MTEPRWITKRGLFLLHEESLVLFGGLAGMRDDGVLESALARPRNLFAYENVTDFARLASAFAFGITKDHPFIDGNKRAAFAAATLFLAKNGVDLTAPQPEAYAAMMELAGGDMSEEEFADWIRANLAPK